jgi:hypothetical protein
MVKGMVRFSVTFQLITYYRQSHVDYSISEVLKQIASTLKSGDEKKQIVLLIYDIMCKWIVHHCGRFEAASLLELPEQLKLIPAIDKFHLGAHILDCFWQYSLNFIKGAAQLDGAVMETLWSELDKVAGFVRGMSAAHRQEVLDDLMMDSNWKKLIGMPEFLTAKLDRAQAGLSETEEAFDSLSRSVGKKWVKRWTRLEEEAFAEGGIGMKIYEAVDTKSE